MSRLLRCAIFAGLVATNSSRAGIIINEITYDDGVTDDREYVELYNNEDVPINIGGWTLGGQHQGINAIVANTTITITTGTVVNPGGFYVIGDNNVLNVNQVVSINFLGNDANTVELRNAGVLQDAVLYESNKGASTNLVGYGVLPSDVAAKVGPGIWGGNQSVDLGTTPPLVSSVGLARYVDGRTTKNNGRDFGYRPNTPGTTNNPVNITDYQLPDISSMAVGTNLSGFAYATNPPRVINPTIVDANNPNAIPPPPTSPDRAVIAWENVNGGGHAVSSAETFATSQAKFDLYAYLDTRDLPQMSMTNGTPFRGSEISIYGIGSTDALAQMTDISGQAGFPDTSNGTTGVAWVYEKVAAPNPSDPSSLVSEKLYLVDAKDGGDAGQGGSKPFYWTILATVDLSNTLSNWFRLGIDIDPLGHGVARFGDQFFNFDTAQQSGAFSVAYRENTQVGSNTVPSQYLRPPTFAYVPEPAALPLLVVGLAVLFAIRYPLARN